MKIQLDRLSESPRAFEFEGDTAWWRAQLGEHGDLPAELAEPLHFSVRAHRMGDDLLLEGSVSGALEPECARCLARYRHSLSEPFRLVLEPAGSRLPADPEGGEALSRAGLCETGWYQGSRLDRAAFFREVLSLALPVKPLCREDCPGLCPRCGADLSRRPCDCAEIEPESPFAVLKTLQVGRTRGDD